MNNQETNRSNWHRPAFSGEKGGRSASQMTMVPHLLLETGVLYRSIGSSARSSFTQSVRRFVHPSIRLSARQSIRQAFCPSVHLSVRRPQATWFKYLTNIVPAVAFGEPLELSDPVGFANLTEKIAVHYAAYKALGVWAEFLPFLLHFPNTLSRQIFRKSLLNMLVFLNERIMRPDAVSGSSYLSTYQREMQKEKEMSKTLSKQLFTESQLRMSLFDLLAAEVRSTVLTIHWVMLFMFKYSKIMEKVQEEIDSNVDRVNIITTNERARLSCTEAVILEV
ncbi:hypothetical protein BV898_03305 [Hypsibius exemplaris]|uniref:Uncharacterized protein n=1 Tax=Hypsibius exemplaris TaxID=2072580 RepID=A0A1W0X5W1_HYPEX|nr:hypothetical protein BV898_03305 [Hypsibius exemplaris]